MTGFILMFNEFGRIAKHEWIETGTLRDIVIIHPFLIMPDQIHEIIQIHYRGSPFVGGIHESPIQKIYKPSFRSPSNNLGSIIRGYKSTVTKQINKIRRTPGLPVWQRNYYEHIIRDEESLHKIREYIRRNPDLWEKDRYFC